VDVVVSSLERSLPFYRELLRRLGLHHLAFDVPSRAVVDERRGVGDRYDPDGLKLEVVHQP
jgi:catechol 2,3-dioxygenase-like lactoylglutathione lyase family enzyme